jgi:hypothetical protein
LAVSPRIDLSVALPLFPLMMKVNVWLRCPYIKVILVKFIAQSHAEVLRTAAVPLGAMDFLTTDQLQTGPSVLSDTFITKYCSHFNSLLFTSEQALIRQIFNLIRKAMLCVWHGRW